MAISLASLKINERKPPRIIIYGDSGCGKTTFAICEHAPPSPDSPPGKARGNVVVLQTEDGLGDIKATSFPLSTSYEEVEEAMGSLYTEEHDFKTLVIDSLDWLEPLIWDYTCRQNGWKTIEEPGYGRGYIATDYVWRQFFAGITALRDDKNMVVIMVAHQQNVTVQDPELPEFQQRELKLHKRAAGIAKEYTDVILHAVLKTVVTNDPSAKKDAVKKNEARQLAVTTGQRIIHTQPRPGATAKNRYHLPPELPLDWAAFDAAMKKSLERQQTS